MAAAASFLHAYVPQEVSQALNWSTLKLIEGSFVDEHLRGSEADLLYEQVGPQMGSNPGGMYRGADGVTRYVKIYSNPSQAYSEDLANQIYRSLGSIVPESGTTVLADGRVAFWSKWVDGLKELGEDFAPAGIKTSSKIRSGST